MRIMPMLMLLLLLLLMMIMWIYSYGFSPMRPTGLEISTATLQAFLMEHKNSSDDAIVMAAARAPPSVQAMATSVDDGHDIRFETRRVAETGDGRENDDREVKEEEEEEEEDDDDDEEYAILHPSKRIRENPSVTTVPLIIEDEPLHSSNDEAFVHGHNQPARRLTTRSSYSSRLLSFLLRQIDKTNQTSLADGNGGFGGFGGEASKRMDTQPAATIRMMGSGRSSEPESLRNEAGKGKSSSSGAPSSKILSSTRRDHNSLDSAYDDRVELK
eukprot:jgi/Bigna1/72092/fgenesh1_pg.18_\